jgi:hypothetical protein
LQNVTRRFFVFSIHFAALASKFPKSGNFFINKSGYQKTQNFMLNSNLMKRIAEKFTQEGVFPLLPLLVRVSAL